MIIDKTLPIYQIVIPNNPISEYYAEKSVDSFNQFGYTNIIRVVASTPANMPNYLFFSEEREYTKERTREWLPEEKAIWYSHYRCWHKIAKQYGASNLGPSLVIEHDCIMTKELVPTLTKRSLWSFGMTEDGRNLAALGYWIKPSMAKELLFVNRISMPVDGYLHSKQDPWYPRGTLKKEYIDTNICATHYINPNWGTTKPKVRKK
tara:strand:+ start:2804 stop:3421 length:618 start_codon:yes stop_codon:yes gene_type:complete